MRRLRLFFSRVVHVLIFSPQPIAGSDGRRSATLCDSCVQPKCSSGGWWSVQASRIESFVLGLYRPNSMSPSEQANLDKLAQTKASFVADNFERVRESVLLLQAFAEQAVLAAPETMTVEAYLTQNSGLTESSSENFDYSVW